MLGRSLPQRRPGAASTSNRGRWLFYRAFYPEVPASSGRFRVEIRNLSLSLRAAPYRVKAFPTISCLSVRSIFSPEPARARPSGCSPAPGEAPGCPLRGEAAGFVRYILRASGRRAHEPDWNYPKRPHGLRVLQSPPRRGDRPAALPGGGPNRSRWLFYWPSLPPSPDGSGPLPIFVLRAGGNLVVSSSRCCREPINRDLGSCARRRPTRRAQFARLLVAPPASDDAVRTRKDFGCNLPMLGRNHPQRRGVPLGTWPRL